MPRRPSPETANATARGRIAENTITARLIVLLHNLGLKADFERIFTTSKGERKPDLWIDLDDGICVGSAKLGVAELDALSTAQEYQQSIGQIYPLKETIAIVYPRAGEKDHILRVLANQNHEAASWKFRDLGAMANKIHDLITSHWSLVRRGREAEDEAMIRLLRCGVEELARCLNQSTLEEIETIFGGREFFQTVLGIENEIEIPREHLRTAAAYLLTNQIVFYERLARETGNFPPIDEETIGDSPSKIQTDYFQKVLDIDYQPIYCFDIVSKLNGIEAVFALKKVILALRALAPHRIERDVLGKVFHELIPLSLRKRVAAYFTKETAAAMLADLVISKWNAQVMDAACGSGSLLVAAYQRKLQLFQAGNSRPISKEIHNQFVAEEITGIDIMPFSAHLAAVQLALQAPLLETNNIRILIHDSLALRPGSEISSVREVFRDAFKEITLDSFLPSTPSGVVTLKPGEKKTVRLNQVDVVLMNPPFTRHERLIPSYKTELETRLSAFSSYLQGQMSLHSYFFFLADLFLIPNGEIGFVIPATTLNLNSADGVRRFLSERYSIRWIITTFQRAAFSEDSEFREVLLIASKRQRSQDERIGIVFLKNIPTNAEEAQSMARRIQQLGNIDRNRWNDNQMDILFLNGRNFDRKYSNWFKFVAVSDLDLVSFWEELTTGNDKLVNFMEYHRSHGSSFLSSLRIERKTLVSTPSTFIVSRTPSSRLEEDRWQIQEIRDSIIKVSSLQNNITIDIPMNVTVPGHRRGSSRRKMDISKEYDRVVVRDFPNANKLFGTSKDQYGKPLLEWEKKAIDRLSNLSLFRRFDLSANGTSHLAFYGTEPYAATDILLTVKGIPDETTKLLTMWYNSTPNILQILLERIETRGSYIETPVFVCERLLIPDFDRVKPDIKNKLLCLFDNVRDVEFPSIIEQLDKNLPLRVQIDMAFLELLGFPKTDLRERVKKFQNQVLNEILKLKDLMRG